MVGGSLFAGFIYTVGPKLSFVFSGIVFLLSVIVAIVHQRSKNILNLKGDY